jgi:hypothetical protein
MNQSKMSKTTIVRSLLLTMVVIFGLLSIIASQPGVWPPTLAEWNVYPDTIFPNGCFVHVEYSVIGGESDMDVRLILEHAATGALVSTWHVGRSFNAGFEGISAELNNGRPGKYVLKLMVEGKMWQQHSIVILQTPTDVLPHTIAYKWPQDLMPSRVLTARTRIQDLRPTLLNVEVKDGQTLPLVLCTKYMKIKSIKFNGASDWENGDRIELSIDGIGDLGVFQGSSERLIFSQPIILRDGMVMQLEHWHSEIGDTARHFMQGTEYVYDFTYEFTQ